MQANSSGGQQPQPAPATPVRRAPRNAPPQFQAERLLKMDAAGLIAVLKNPKSTEFEKAKACQFLASKGGADAVPALAALLTDPKLSHYGRYGLEPNPDPSAGDALRAALPRVKGGLLVGVVNSLGARKDVKAVAPLAKLLSGADAEAARAAAWALGQISGPEAAKALQDGLARTKGSVQEAVADGCLRCAEGLLAQGQRDRALALYSALTGPAIPKPARLAAMHGIIAAEISLSRPR